MNNDEFEKDLEIDIESLEVEACRQPELYFRYSKLTVEARENYDSKKLRLSVIESELSKKVRLKPGAFGLAKTTEASIKEAVSTHPQYITAYKRMIKAKNEADLLFNAQNAMDQRKRMLELLVQLHGREYFAGPSVPHTPEQFWKRINEKKGVKIQKEMVNRGRKRKVKKP